MPGLERLMPIFANLLELVGIPHAFATIITDAIPRIVGLVMRHDNPETAKAELATLLDGIETAIVAQGAKKFGE